MSRGLFITFEGPDGSGKSTQIRRLGDRLRERGEDPLLTREPGGTDISEKIRTLILDPANTAMDPRTEALLYAASRAQLVHQVIEPALREGRTVLCDRFMDSSIAYQGYARGLGTGVRDINEFAVGGLAPDITFFLDLDPEKGLLRAGKAKGKPDRMEREALSFHRAVYEGYLALSRIYADRFVIIDASRTEEEVFAAIWERMESYERNA